jgi:uncharacterized protein (TIGR03437 family)
MGGNRTPALADTQRVRSNAGNVYVNSNNLPSYTLGPWFEATMTGGVFMNWASSGARLVQITRNPAAATTKTATGLGPIGMWVNGVAIFNELDGGSYSTARGDDQGGGGVSQRASHFSAASQERGPLAAGSLVSAYAEFDAILGSTTASATSASWPTTLGGTTVTVTDASGVQLPAGILYVSPKQVNYQMPSTAAPGLGRVSITANGVAVNGTVNIAAAYPGLFSVAQTQVADGQAYVVLYGTGIGTAAVTAKIGAADAKVLYSGPQGTYPGLDQVNLLAPPGINGGATVTITAGGKLSNAVNVNLQ